MGTPVWRLLLRPTHGLQGSRAAYQPKMERLGVDFGLATLIATSEGMLFGRGLIADLKRIDHQLVEIRRLL